MDLGWLARASGRLACHPSLWLTALHQIFVLAPARWWRRAPYLPVPDKDYLRFRLQTMYGDPGRKPEPGDLVNYLRWCRAWPAAIRR